MVAECWRGANTIIALKNKIFHIWITDKKLQLPSSNQGGVEVQQPSLGSFHSLLSRHRGL